LLVYGTYPDTTLHNVPTHGKRTSQS